MSARIGPRAGEAGALLPRVVRSDIILSWKRAFPSHGVGRTMDSDLTNEATQGQAAGERAPELMPGDRIEVYRVIRLLGRGG